MSTGFLTRYAAAFGRSEALMRRLSGLLGGEVAAEGAWIVDTAGRRWLDFGSFGLHLLGHRHPAVTAAATKQLDLMGLSGKVLGNDAATRCAEALIDATPANLDRAVLANTGAEAVDMAVKMVLLATGRDEFLAFRRSYHGKTMGALSLSDAAGGGDRFGLRNPVHFLEPDDIGPVRELLATGRIAGVFIEPIQGEGGIRPVAREFLEQLRQVCTTTGTPLVLDEIQTGLGRCGRRWRSADDCRPDLLLVGKTLGGGLLPVSAVVFSSATIGATATDPVVLASSFAGGALAATVGETVVDLVCDEHLLDRVRDLGLTARTRLADGLAANPRVREVRGEGLMIGVELDDPALAGNVVIEAARRDLLISFCLSRPNVIRIYPPVVIDRAELIDGLDAFVGAVNAASLPAAAATSPSLDRGDHA
ncbi:aspartate aminotransferase family protein [Micromonospora echinofusca]|uniref:Aminotransferase class III-fold pyridoxal phosphate-dependent enzyme n=1 Tax=Micromonospora echinofusca TaxID=47858 RepID=A0ABS3VWW1_MICEH|nr:aspartate aminotransferase family protein [Micromonospora echinofusca]MBO4208918.1 aminotransferase class III-fold pyridoxal phosphate-dependent enzyme [Micromonospora echinofusca]